MARVLRLRDLGRRRASRDVTKRPAVLQRRQHGPQAWLFALSAAVCAAPAHADNVAPSCGELCFLDDSNAPLVGAKAAVHVSSYVTNGPTLPAADDYAGRSRAPNDLRIQVDDPRAAPGAFATLESRTAAGILRATLQLPLTRLAPGQPLRSAYVRLVADEVDGHARGAESRTLRVALRDHVRVRYLSGQRALERSLRVGLAGDHDVADSARRAHVIVHILRVGADGQPVIGQDDSSALSVMRQQLSAANEIWLQCNLSFGEPTEVAMEIVQPPTATLLAIANEDGLPARGGGELRFRVDGQSVGPIPTRAAATPTATAQVIADTLRKLGFYAKVSENLPTRSGAGPSTDVLVRKKSGGFVTITPEENAPLSTDQRQSLQIGNVDLGDGLQEFDNTTAQVGSLEERTMLKALSDEDPHSIDIFVVNQFTAATRQGEAFIADPAGPITNSVVIDRNGLRHAPLAWTLAHELGHVLMNDPLHPDNVGPDRPWLLMDADSGRGTVDGPKRLRPADCQRMRETSRRARHPLLTAFDRNEDAAASGDKRD